LTRNDFQIVARLRLREARTLARNGHEQGVYYLGGVAAECALKACIAKQTKKYEFPPSRRVIDRTYAHDLEELLATAGLKAQLELDMKTNPSLAAHWTVVKSWNIDSRYRASGLSGRDMLAALSGPNGVISWVRQDW